MDDSKDISFSNLTDAISAVDYNYNTIDLTDLNSGITVAGQTYTMAPLTASMPTVSISSISGANVGYSNTMWTTGTSGFNGTSAMDLNQSGKLSLQGTNADIDINGRSLMKTLDALQERLNMLTPNPEMEAEWDQLRELGERYRELEQQCREKNTNVEQTQIHAQTQRKIMTSKQRIKHITKWIKSYATKNKISTLVVGISGGIDSSVVSALCAETGLKTIVVQMPIRQAKTLDNRSSMQATWLLERYKDNVTHMSMDLTPVYAAFEKKVDPYCYPESGSQEQTDLAFANSRARLRMMTLYQIAQSHGGIVVGTGNKVEDFGVGFYTKYGDGGVDISPIGDCLKTEVWDMGREFGLPQEIIDAAPTDGLWTDGRTDEDQMGMSYPELERAMANDVLERQDVYNTLPIELGREERAQLKKYRAIRARNMHKMLPIPVCEIKTQ